MNWIAAILTDPTPRFAQFVDWLRDGRLIRGSLTYFQKQERAVTAPCAVKMLIGELNEMLFPPTSV